MRSLLLSLLLLGLALPVAAAEPGAQGLAARARAELGAIPLEAANPADPANAARVELGRMLFYDVRLSTSRARSCNSCHTLDRYGVDGEPTPAGDDGLRGPRNAPSVYHAAFHVGQHWDGRYATLESQARAALLGANQLAQPDEQTALAALQAIVGYEPLFAQAFPGEEEPLSLDNAGRALGAFERGLVTQGRFDYFVNGDLEALDAREQRGLALFLDSGCTTCHSGPAIGGRSFQRLGLLYSFPTADEGRFAVTGEEGDRYVFKVPSLRNVAETGPWFHDGQITSLEEAVRLMGFHQLGIALTPGQISDLVTFLRTLTGRMDAQYIWKPELP